MDRYDARIGGFAKPVCSGGTLPTFARRPRRESEPLSTLKK